LNLASTTAVSKIFRSKDSAFNQVKKNDFLRILKKEKNVVHPKKVLVKTILCGLPPQNTPLELSLKRCAEKQIIIIRAARTFLFILAS